MTATQTQHPSAKPRILRRRGRYQLAALLLTMACVGGHPLHALAMTELVLQLDSSLRYDSNPLRFTQDADIQAALGVAKKSDAVLANDVRFAVVHPLDSPQTRLLLTGQLGRRNYNQLTQLDNWEYAYKGALEWRWGDLWKGEFAHAQEQLLYGYLDGSLTTREMYHRTTDNVEVALRATPELDIPLAGRNRRVQYDSPVNWIFDSEERSVDLGVRFLSQTRSLVRGGVRSTEVQFPRRDALAVANLDSGYRDNELYAEADWQYSVFTRLGGRVSALNRKYDSLTTKNFSALTTEFRAIYEHSPLTRLTLEYWSRPYGTTDRTTLYTLVTGAQLGVRWQATPKTRVSALLTSEQQKYQYLALDPGQANPQLHRVRWGGGVVYAISRDVRAYVDGFREHLDRGSLGAGISQNLLRVGIEYTYENITGLAQRTGLGDRR